MLLNGRSSSGGSHESKAKQARKALGLGVRDAARRANICEAYLRRVENTGAGYALAERLSRIYGCPIDHFLNYEGYETSKEPPRRHRDSRKGLSRDK
jgi:transcriptional regulator with XRE-family HTH domain